MYAKVHALLIIVILTLVVQHGFNEFDDVSLGSDSMFADWRTIFRKFFFKLAFAYN